MRVLAVIALALLAFSGLVWANSIATLRGGPIDREAEAPNMPKVENKELKRKRSYPMQPPIIPHSIDGYKVSTNVNTCLSCHSRKRSEQSQAPMVSITHFMDRDANFLAAVSPRRYFCSQCHVVQLDTPLIVENDFVDMDALIEESGGED